MAKNDDEAFLSGLEGGKPAKPAASGGADADADFLAGLEGGAPKRKPSFDEIRKESGAPSADEPKPAPRQYPADRVSTLKSDLAAATAEPEPDRVAPGGLTGVVTGRKGGPTAADTRLAPTVANRFYRGVGLGIAPLFGAAIDTGVSKIPGVRNVAEAFNSLGEQGGHPGLSPLTNPNLTYQQRLDEYRARDDAQAEAHPLAANLAETLGGVAPSILTAGTLAPATAATGIAAGRGALPTLGRAMATGAGYSAVSAAGNTRAPTLKGKLADVGLASTIGAVVGGASETAAGLLTRNAGKRLANDITREIVEGSGEHGAGTATAARAVARDKADIVKLVTSDAEIAKAVRQPAAKALPVIKAKIAEEGAQLGPHYDVIDEAVGGTRVGDWVDHLEKAAAKLRATAKGKDAQVAGQLEAAAKRAREGADWGGGEHFDPTVEVTPGVTAAQQIELMEKVAKIPAQAAVAQKEIARVRALATKPGYDPDRIVPTQQLRGVVTDLQNTAYDALGGIHGTEAHKKSVEVAHVGEDFLRAHLDKAEKAGDAAAQAVSEIRRINPRFSALKNIQKALDQRGDKEERGATSLRAHLTKVVHGGAGLAAAHAIYRGHPGEAALELATAYALPKLAATLPPIGNRALARLVSASSAGSVPAALIQQAIEAGVPRATALKLAGAVSASGAASDAVGGDNAP